MRKTFLLLLSVIVFSLLPSTASADCADLGNATNWVREGEHTVVFHMGNKPAARLNLSDCEIHSFATIRLTKSYVCDSGSIMVDGKECSITTLKLPY